jgi:hypothetical protein
MIPFFPSIDPFSSWLHGASVDLEGLSSVARSPKNCRSLYIYNNSPQFIPVVGSAKTFSEDWMTYFNRYFLLLSFLILLL